MHAWSMEKNAKKEREGKSPHETPGVHVVSKSSPPFCFVVGVTAGRLITVPSRKTVSAECQEVYLLA